MKDLKKSKKFVCFAASDEGGGGKQARALQAGGPRPDRALPQSVVLQRRSLLQQSESTQQHVPLHKLHVLPFTSRPSSFCVVPFQYEIAIVTEEGVEIISPLSSETNWDIAHMVR